MAKISPKDKESKTPKPRRCTRASSNNKYLRPGALAQLRYTKSTTTKACTDIGKERHALCDLVKVNKNELEKVSKTSKQKKQTRASGNANYLRPGAVAQLRYNTKSLAAIKGCTGLRRERVPFSDLSNVDELVIPQKVISLPENHLMMSPERFGFSLASPLKLVKQNSLPNTPKTPHVDCDSESRFEALPTDLLVRILCHLHHDQLKAVFHVSQRVRMAVIVARQFHFNYTTPDRSRQEMLQTMTPVATEHWPFVWKGESKGFRMPSPHTPKAPRHGPRPPSRLKYSDTKQVAAALFQEASIPSMCMIPSVLSKPLCKNRVLFYEDELCQAVAQNKLR